MAFTLWNFKVYNNKSDVLSLREHRLFPLNTANTGFHGKAGSPAAVPLNTRMAFKPVIHRASFIFYEEDQFMHHPDSASILREVCCAFKLFSKPEKPELKTYCHMAHKVTWMLLSHCWTRTISVYVQNLVNYIAHSPSSKVALSLQNKSIRNVSTNLEIMKLENTAYG